MGRITLAVVVAILAAACAQTLERSPSTTAAAASPTTSAVSGADGSIPSCSVFPRVSAPAEVYADTPIYVANEMPIEEVREWAETQPGFESIWIDRGRNGWITVAFSRNADARQADLEELFPGVGVVAVAVDWSVDELRSLQERVTAELGTFLDSYSTWASESSGVVGIGVGVLTDEIRAEMEKRFAGERVCLEGRDPSSVPAAGPQPLDGDGWRLLVDEPGAGWVYRTGIATDAAGLQGLWEEIGLDGPPPEVDFTDEVVVWFGAVYGSSCPNIRLDDVVVDGTTLYAEIVLPNAPVACTDDANAHAYVVAVQRAMLPEGPFVIQLDADGPPGGAPEERTVVAVDLSQPGAVAQPDDIGSDPNLPEPRFVVSGDTIEPGYPIDYALVANCGTAWLGELNGVNWYAEEPPPPEWDEVLNTTGTLIVSILLGTDPPTVAATAGDVTVTYLPTRDPIPTCD